MELLDINLVNGNPKNPRKISKEDFENLKRSIAKFGDLGCIVKNVRSNQLVSGHQRMQAFKAFSGDKKLIIEERFDTPNQVGTIAEGRLWFNNENYKYREVDWDEGTEAAANIAANRIQGEFDRDMLAELNYEISQLENGSELLDISGQSSRELESLNKMIGVVPESEPPAEGTEPEEPTKLEFALTKDQREIVEEAVGNAKVRFDMAASTNSSINGNAIFFICREYLDRVQGLVDNSNAVPAEGLPVVQSEPVIQIDPPSEERLDAAPQA